MQITELSYSSLWEFVQTCPLKWYYRKVAFEDPEFIPAELSHGLGFHKAIEQFLKAKKVNRVMSLDEIMVPYSEAFDDPKIRYNGQTRSELADEAYELLKLATEMPMGKILGVEVPVEIQLARDFKIVGYIDVLSAEKSGRSMTITDWKTWKRRPSTDDLNENSQLTTYSLAYPDADLRIVALLKQKKPVLEQYSTTRNAAQRKRLINMFWATKKAMEANQWFPREGWWCSGCPYAKKCHEDF